MGVNRACDFEAPKSASIHHKSNPYGLIKAFWSKVMRFWKEKYPYL